MDQETRRARREERRRAIRRRRLIFASLLALSLIAIAAIVLSAGSGGSSSGTHPATAPGRSAGKRRTGSYSSAAGQQASAHTGPPGQTPVPILMYHVIAEPPAGAPFPGLYVSPAEFAEQMSALERAGWHARTPDQGRAYWRRGGPLGTGRPIEIG